MYMYIRSINLQATAAIIQQTKITPIDQPVNSDTHCDESPPSGGTRSLAIARPRLPFSKRSIIVS